MIIVIIVGFLLIGFAPLIEQRSKTVCGLLSFIGVSLLIFCSVGIYGEVKARTGSTMIIALMLFGWFGLCFILGMLVTHKG